jgi:hypothetical protein
VEDFAGSGGGGIGGGVKDKDAQTDSPRYMPDVLLIHNFGVFLHGYDFAA